MQRPNVGKLCSSPGTNSSNIQLVNKVGKASASCGLSFGDKEHSPHAHWPTHMLLVVSPSRKIRKNTVVIGMNDQHNTWGLRVPNPTEYNPPLYRDLHNNSASLAIVTAFLLASLPLLISLYFRHSCSSRTP